MEHITKDSIGQNAEVIGRLYQIGPIQQVTAMVAHRCRRCGTTYANRPKSCNNKVDGNPCKGEEFTRRAYDGTLEDQRFIEINLSENKTSGEMSFYDTSTFLIDLRGELARDFDYEFGDVVKATGFLEYSETPSKQPHKEVDAFFIYMRAVDVKKVSEELIKKVVVVTDEDKKRFRNWAKTEGDAILEDLIGSVAPHIHGRDDLKLFGLIQIVGAKTDRSRARTDIHGLCVGDPSTGKSEIAMALSKVAEGIYTSCEDLRKTGIVAGMVKNEKIGQWMWEPGIALLTEKLKALDEIDKNKTVGLFDQLVNILDKGFYTLRGMRRRDFRTPGPWLLLMNPKDGKYDINKSLVKNIDKLSIPLLNRMDMIFVFRKTYIPDQAEEILNRVVERFEGRIPQVMSEENLMKYLKVAIENTAIEVEPEVYESLKKEFHSRSTETVMNDSGLMITERQFEGLIRIATARAKLLLKDKVTKEDAVAAIAMFKAAFDEAIKDPSTGQPDLLQLDGRMKSESKNASMVEKILKKGELSFEFILDEIEDNSQLSREAATELLKDLIRRKDIVKGNGENIWRNP